MVKALILWRSRHGGLPRLLGAHRCGELQATREAQNQGKGEGVCDSTRLLPLLSYVLAVQSARRKCCTQGHNIRTCFLNSWKAPWLRLLVLIRSCSFRACTAAFFSIAYTVTEGQWSSSRRSVWEGQVFRERGNSHQLSLDEGVHFPAIVDVAIYPRVETVQAVVTVGLERQGKGRWEVSE